MAMQNIYNYQRPKVMPRVMNSMNQKPKVNISNTIKKNGNARSDQYLEQKILSARPEELTLMLFDGMVKFLKQAVLYNDTKNIEKASNAILRAEAIISELSGTLDKSYEISGSLELMYDYMERRLIDANMEKNTEIINEVLGYSEELRDTWKEAMKLAK